MARELTRMYPIMDGPSVPWEVMAPHESMAQKNHSQSLARLAERGGLEAGEAWCIVNGLHVGIIEKGQWGTYRTAWLEYADRINLHYDDLAALRQRCEELEREAKDLHLEQIDEGNQLRKLAHDIAVPGTPLPGDGPISGGKLREVVEAALAHRSMQKG